MSRWIARVYRDSGLVDSRLAANRGAVEDVSSRVDHRDIGSAVAAQIANHRCIPAHQVHNRRIGESAVAVRELHENIIGGGLRDCQISLAVAEEISGHEGCRGSRSAE